MTQYDAIYEQYGQHFPLTAEDEAGLEQARQERERLLRTPGMTPGENGFVDERGGFTLDPVTARHIAIATRLAERQLGELPVMPEDMEAAVRFPAVDPVGVFSVIDMKFAQRLAAVEGALQTRETGAGKYGWGLAYDITSPDGPCGKVRAAMLRAAGEHRTLARGSKLCHDDAGRRIMYQRTRDLETCAAVTDYDKMMQGAEYAAGLRTGPVPQEVRDFYHNVLGEDLDLDMIARAETPRPPMEGLFVKFEDLDNKLLHQVQADPKNWGRTGQELRELADGIREDTVLEAIPPYVRGTVDRVIDPAFAAQEKASGGLISRADLIIVDGKTVREKMLEDYRAAHWDTDKFDAFFRENAGKATGEYVAAALMAGKRVEAFVPDKRGRIPAEPAQILPAEGGYKPSPLKPERFNAWQRFFSRHGFYKEKVARQQEYERMMAARERVRLTNTAHQWELAGGSPAERKECFFGSWLRENGGSLGFQNPFGADAADLDILAVSNMLFQGYSLEETLDPDSQQAVKAEVGRDVCENLKRGDMKWVGETLVHGLLHLRNELDRSADGLDMADESQMLSADRRLTAHACRFASAIAGLTRRECCASVCNDVMDAHMKHLGRAWRGEDYLDRLCDGLNAATAYFDAARKAMAGRAELAGGLVSSEDAKERIVDQMRYEVAKAGFAAPADGAPKTGMSQRFTRISPLYAPFSSFGFVDSYRDFLQRAGDPKLARSVGEGFMEGRLQQRIKVSERGEYDYAVEVAPPTQKGDLELRSAKELEAAKAAPQKQAAAKTQKPPQMGGPKR